MLRRLIPCLIQLTCCLVTATACGRGSPPEPELADKSAAPLGAPFDASFAAVPTTSAAIATPDAGARSDKTAVDDAGVDPSTLPQTNDRPKASGAAFDARVAALFAAIVSDTPDDALPAFFPVHAYEQVKALPNPAGDWRRRLVAAYTRDIHKLHQKLGADPSKATFSRIEVPEERARWVEPGEEGNKLGYYRVYGTRIWYEVDGKQRSFDVTSLISWRGEWYVVHLAGFK
jgi:hypothetical protein